MKKKIGITTVGRIPKDIWEGKWFVGKLQIPIMTTETNPPALIYDESRKWSLYVPIEFLTKVHMGDEKKKYLWMWFDEEHGLRIEEGTPVKDEQYW